MAAQGYYPTIVRSDGPGIGSPDVIRLLEADSQTFVRGSLVYAVAGKATVVPDSGAVILGIAQAAATNVTSAWTTIPIEVIRPGTRLRIRCWDNAAESASNGGANAKLTRYGLHLATDLHYLDFNDTDDVLVFIEEDLAPGQSSGDSYYAIVEVLPAVCQIILGVDE